MFAIFDTDFDTNDKIIVCAGGEEIYRGLVANMPYNVKEHAAQMDWYALDENMENGFKAVFIG